MQILTGRIPIAEKKGMVINLQEILAENLEDFLVTQNWKENVHIKATTMKCGKFQMKIFN